MEHQLVACWFSATYTTTLNAMYVMGMFEGRTVPPVRGISIDVKSRGEKGASACTAADQTKSLLLCVKEWESMSFGVQYNVCSKYNIDRNVLFIDIYIPLASAWAVVPVHPYANQTPAYTMYTTKCVLKYIENGLDIIVSRKRRPSWIYDLLGHDMYIFDRLM